MNEHHSEISEDRFYFFEQQEVVVEDVESSGYILDIGGGGEGIIGRLKDQQVVAIDPNKRELEEAATGPLKIVMDATDLKFLDHSFAIVTAFFTLMYIKELDHKQVLMEVFRVLVSGGRFLIWDGMFPARTDEEKDVAVFPLLITLPKEEITTGYGALWPKEGRDVSYYLKLANDAGFEVVSQREPEVIEEWRFR